MINWKNISPIESITVEPNLNALSPLSAGRRPGAARLRPANSTRARPPRTRCRRCLARASARARRRHPRLATPNNELIESRVFSTLAACPTSRESSISNASLPTTRDIYTNKARSGVFVYRVQMPVHRGCRCRCTRRPRPGADGEEEIVYNDNDHESLQHRNPDICT